MTQSDLSPSVINGLRILYEVYHNPTGNPKHKADALQTIEWAALEYAEHIQLSQPRLSRLVVVRSSPVEREFKGATITFHDQDGGVT